MLEGAPIDITRRYQSAFTQQLSPVRPAIPPAVITAQLIESDSESESSDFEVTSRPSKTKRSVSKSSTVVGISRAPVASSSNEHAAKADIVEVVTTPVKSTEPRKRKSKTPSAMDTDGPKSPAATSSSEKKKRKRSSSIGSNGDEAQFSPTRKTPVRAARHSEPKHHDLASSDEEEEQATPTPRVKKHIVPKKNPKKPSAATHRVYLSSAPAGDKTYYKSNLNHLMTFVTDVTQATHIVAFDSTETDSPISFSVLYGIAMAKWVLDKSWLIDTEASDSPVPEDAYQLRDLPGLKILRKSQAARKSYLEDNGLSELTADDLRDKKLPPLLFTTWTFCMDRIKSAYPPAVLKQMHEMIIANGGKIGGEANSDIWITKDASQPVLCILYGDPGPPPAAEAAIRKAHPEWNKRHFQDPNTLREMPTYAIPFDFVRDSITSGKCEDPKDYTNLIQFTRGL